MANAGVSRSGRVRKKSAKLIEMEQVPSLEEDPENKAKTIVKWSDDESDSDDSKVTPTKVPKFSNQITKRSPQEPAFKTYKPHSEIGPKTVQIPVKGRPTSSSSSETSSPSCTSESSSSEDELPPQKTSFNVKRDLLNMPAIKSEPPLKFMEGSESDSNEGDNNLIIAEDSQPRKKVLVKTMPKDFIRMKIDSPESADDESPVSEVVVKKTPIKKKRVSKKLKNGSDKSMRPLTAYMLWCRENRKRIVSINPGMDFSHISKKMGEVWQSLSDKEKTAWKRKAKRLANATSNMISTGKPILNKPAKPVASNFTNDSLLDDTPLEGPKVIGITSIDSAAYLKLLGESLSTIGQRLTEHEGQIAVSGSLSVLLDSSLCALGPILALTTQSPEFDACSKETLTRILDNVAYIMPGL